MRDLLQAVPAVVTAPFADRRLEDRLVGKTWVVEARSRRRGEVNSRLPEEWPDFGHILRLLDL